MSSAISWGAPAGSGPQGPVGPQGNIGPDGPVGPSGATGPEGPVGPAGPTGSQGPVGPQGDIGPDGGEGPRGLGGPAGAKGDTGDTGAQGPQGLQGEQGIKGDTGSQGPQGATGPQGNQGERGDAGPQGSQGPQGVAGETGPEGPAGPQGITGASGPQGSQGIAGATGPTGATGPQGVKGDTGEAGPAGPTGQTGSQGPAGIQGNVGPTGSQGVKGDTGDTGPAGPTGAQGPTGSQGATGPQGVAGPTGATGATGATGSANPGDELLLLTHTDPTPPAADTVGLFRRKIAGRQMPAFVGPSGLDSALQPLLARNKVGFWCPPGNAATVPGVFGFTAYTALGTARSRVVATTNVFTRMRRLGYVSAATAAAICGARVAVGQITTGTTIGSVAVGGFFKVIRFGISDASLVATARMFVGIGNSAAPTNVEPSTLTNCIGIGHGAADTNLFLYYGGSAAQPPINLGASFPITTNVDPYELALFCAPGSTTINWQVTRLSTGATASGTLNGTPGTQVPAPTTLLSYAQNWRCNNATLAAVGLDIFSDYIETDQ